MIINYKNIFNKNKVFIKYMSINNFLFYIHSFKRQSKIEKYIKNLKQENYI